MNSKYLGLFLRLYLKKHHLFVSYNHCFGEMKYYD